MIIFHNCYTDSVLFSVRNLNVDFKDQLISNPSPDTTVSMRGNPKDARGLMIRKIFICILEEFANSNHYSKSNPVVQTREVYINIESFLTDNGYSIMSSNQAKRINYIKKLKKQFKASLRMLSTMEVRKTTPTGRSVVGVVEKFHVKNNDAYVLLDHRLAEELVKSSLTFIPDEIKKIGGNHLYALLIAIKLCDQYYKTSNKKKGTNTKIGIEKIFAVLPTDLNSLIEHDRSHWRINIKELVENNLNYLKGIVLKDWHYECAKGKCVDINSITSPHEYLKEAYIRFDLL